MPTLSERREDVPAMAQYFRLLYQRQFDKECDPLGPEILNYLENLNWPGNVRELSNCIARFVLIGQDAFAPKDVPPRSKTLAPSGSTANGNLTLKNIAKEAIQEMERNVILEALRTNRWNRRKTAEVLRISYRALIYKIRDAGLISRRGTVVQSPSGSTGLAGSSLCD
jgi:two-component system response regulator AtoC